MTPMIDAAAYARLRDENARLTEKLAAIEQAAYVVHNHALHDLDTLRALILEHLGPVVRTSTARADEVDERAALEMVRNPYALGLVPAGSGAPTEEKCRKLRTALGHLWQAAKDYGPPLNCDRKYWIGLLDESSAALFPTPQGPGATAPTPGAVTVKQIAAEISARFPADEDLNVIAAARHYFRVEETAKAVLALFPSPAERTPGAVTREQIAREIHSVAYPEHVHTGLCPMAYIIADRIQALFAQQGRDLADSTAQLALDDEAIAALREEKEEWARRATDRLDSIAALRADIARLEFDLRVSRENADHVSRLRHEEGIAFRAEVARLTGENNTLRGPLTTKLRAADAVERDALRAQLDDATAKLDRAGEDFAMKLAAAEQGRDRANTTLHAWFHNMEAPVKAALAEEWPDASAEVFEGGNAGWTMVLAVAVRMLREKLGDAQQERDRTNAVCVTAVKENIDLHAQLATAKKALTQAQAVARDEVIIKLEGEQHEAAAREAILREEYRRLVRMIEWLASKCAYHEGGNGTLPDSPRRIKRVTELIAEATLTSTLETPGA